MTAGDNPGELPRRERIKKGVTAEDFRNAVSGAEVEVKSPVEKGDTDQGAIRQIDFHVFAPLHRCKALNYG